MSRFMLTNEQIEDLLDYIGTEKIGQWKGDRIQFCCPVHRESTPSCGINADFTPDDKPGVHLQVFNCFSCGAKGTLPKLLYLSLPDKFKNIGSAINFIQSRYNVEYHHVDLETLIMTAPRYEELFRSFKKEKRTVLSYSDLAPYRSGKETYQYFFSRGFDKEDVQEYLIGRDISNKTVTIPVFWEDGSLAGIIGRYIDNNRPKNMRFKIYNFNKGNLIYPLDKLVPFNDTLIGVESLFDAIMLRKWGYLNAVSIMGMSMTNKQSDLIAKHCKIFIPLFDMDLAGRNAISVAKEKLGNRVMVMEPSYYPELGKDPIEWGEMETMKVISSSCMVGKELPRYT